MEIKPSNSAIFLRFGLIGTFLYRKFHNYSSWNKKNYVFTLFAGTFFILFTVLLILLFLIFKSSANLFLLVGIVFLCSLVYGYWAKSFFKKYVQ